MNNLTAFTAFASNRCAYVIVLVVLGLTLVLPLVQPPAALSQGAPHTYTYRDNSCGPAVAADPINIVFVNTLFTQEVDDHWQAHFPSWTTASDTPNQFATNDSGACVTMGRERADGGNLDWSRYHARMTQWGWGTEPVLSASGWHVHIGAHHEEQGFLTFPQPPVPVGHVISEDGFNRARNEVYYGFAEHHPVIAWISWGNTRRIQSVVATLDREGLRWAGRCRLGNGRGGR